MKCTKEARNSRPILGAQTFSLASDTPPSGDWVSTTLGNSLVMGCEMGANLPDHCVDAEVEHVLHNVVPEGICHEFERMPRNFVHKAQALFFGCVVDAALHNAAAVPMRGNIDAPRDRGVVNKLLVRGAEFLQTALDDVVAIEVLDQLDHTMLQSLDDRLDLRAYRTGLHDLYGVGSLAWDCFVKVQAVQGPLGGQKRGVRAQAHGTVRYKGQKRGVQARDEQARGWWA